MNAELYLLGAKAIRIDSQLAREAWMDARLADGWKSYQPLLTPPSANLKLGKSKTVATYGLALSQARTSGHNFCNWSTASCRASCVGLNGNGRFDTVPRARATKSRFLLANPDAFLTVLADELDQGYARHAGKVAVRLNTFSDLTWEVIAPWLFNERPKVRFYDYTKNWARKSTEQYHLTYSASEKTTDEAIEAYVTSGRNVAVVFGVGRTKPLPASWHGLRVIDGDKTDARGEDPKGVIIGLRAKGSMKQETRGMVRRDI